MDKPGPKVRNYAARGSDAGALARFMVFNSLGVKELARAVGVAHTTVLKIATGQTRPSFETASRIVIALGQERLKVGDFWGPERLQHREYESDYNKPGYLR